MVVGTGGSGFGGYTYGGPRVISDERGGEDRRYGHSGGLLVKWVGYCSKHILRDRS